MVFAGINHFSFPDEWSMSFQYVLYNLPDANLTLDTYLENNPEFLKLALEMHNIPILFEVLLNTLLFKSNQVNIHRDMLCV